MGAHELLKAVGYWRPNDSWEWGCVSELPKPRWLVRRGWRSRERRQILAYLRSGQLYARYAGYSYCRFWLCWAPHRLMGDSDLTDGVWVWPQGLAHYVERHHVCLPEEFVDTMQVNGWKVPGNIVAWGPECGDLHYDLSFWVAWSRQQRGQPWYLFW